MVIAINFYIKILNFLNFFRTSQNVSVENVDEWLNAKFFSNVIKNHLNITPDDYEIISIETKPATKPGENFMSFLFVSKLEIMINGADKMNLSYIVKCMLKRNVYNEGLISAYDAFPKEKKNYIEILPAFEKLYEDVGIDVKFGPKLYYSTEDPIDIIVLELLEDYRMRPKIEGLDVEHVKRTLQWLAQFHAASMKFYELNGPYGEDYKDGVFAESVEKLYQPFYDSYFNHYIEALKKLKNGDKYVEKAENWRGNLYNLILKTIKFDENSPLNVLCHGDMWSNNLMFKYSEDGSISDLKTVDYQLLFYGTPAKDLFNFMMTSWRPDIKIKEFDNFISFYHENLAENLKILKFQKPIPTLQQLNEELMKRKFLMTAMTVELLPFPLNEMVISTSEDISNWLTVFYNNPRCEAVFEEVFPWLDAMGALEMP